VARVASDGTKLSWVQIPSEAKAYAWSRSTATDTGTSSPEPTWSIGKQARTSGCRTRRWWV